MKKTIAKIAAVTLVLALAAPTVALPKAEAAAKAPKLSTDDITIYTGKTKTITIKNVKKKDVKSLTVKAFNESSTVVKKKILTKNKVGFTLKATGPHGSAVRITLKLKKKIAGKKTYKWEIITTTGSAAKPVSYLEDDVTGSYTALVLKEGEEPEGGDNEFSLISDTYADIGVRNLEFKWFKDGEVVDTAYQRTFRPDTTKVVDQEKGYDESVYHCEVTNWVSKKTVTTNSKKCLIVTQKFIDAAIADLKTFSEKYAFKTSDELPTDAEKITQYLEDYKVVMLSFGRSLGITPELIDELESAIERSNPTGAAELLKQDTAAMADSMKVVGRYLGISEADVEEFAKHFAWILVKSATDSNYKPKKD